MVEVIFIGVGEACDPMYPNTSLLVKNDEQQVLLDCGFSTPPLFFKSSASGDELDGLWISHFHGDHFFGTPLLLLRFWEMGRSRLFTIMGRPGVAEIIRRAMDLAYPNMYSRLGFPIEFIELEPGAKVAAAGFSWQAAVNDHPEPCLAIRVEQAGKALFYSGDGRPTPESLQLARGCDLVVHEAFRASGETPGHGTISGCLDFARRAGVANLALLHIQRNERREKLPEIRAAIAGSGLNVLLPEPGETFKL